MLDVPTVRAMHELEPLAEAAEAKTTWSRRKGLVFLGAVIISAAAAFYGYVESTKPASIDQAAVLREVQSLSPAESFRRLKAAQTSLPAAIVSRYKPGENLFNLAPAAIIIAQFEQYHPEQRLGPPALAHAMYLNRIEQAARYAQLRVWLPVAAVVGIIGLLVAGSALLVPTSQPNSKVGTTPAKRRKVRR
jgi:hypothetical protein